MPRKAPWLTPWVIEEQTLGATPPPPLFPRIMNMDSFNHPHCYRYCYCYFYRRFHRPDVSTIHPPDDPRRLPPA